jgi:hypothetical protein
VASAIQHIRFRTALWLWGRIVPVLAWRSDVLTLLRRASPGHRRPYVGLSAAHIARRAKRAVRRPRLMADRPCLREGVLADRFLRLAGYAPELHFGVERNSLADEILRAHCWVVLDGQALLNAPATEMIEVMVRDRDARIRVRGQAPAGAEKERYE